MTPFYDDDAGHRRLQRRVGTPGAPVVIEVCTRMVDRPLSGEERAVALMVEYLAQCRMWGVESDWCLTCGAYVAVSLDDCTCPAGVTRR
jgi:hypothetical protein